MQYTDEQNEKMLELKESIVDKMAKHQDELDFLQKNLDILDVVLKGSSFTKASSLPRKSESSVESMMEKEEANVESMMEKENTAESIQIKKNKDGEVIANAFVTPEKISIIMSEGIGLTDEIPPLRSFFIERIIGEMKKTDSVDVKNGKIDQGSERTKAAHQAAKQAVQHYRLLQQTHQESAAITPGDRILDQGEAAHQAAKQAVQHY